MYNTGTNTHSAISFMKWVSKNTSTHTLITKCDNISYHVRFLSIEKNQHEKSTALKRHDRIPQQKFRLLIRRRDRFNRISCSNKIYQYGDGARTFVLVVLRVHRLHLQVYIYMCNLIYNMIHVRFRHAL